MKTLVFIVPLLLHSHKLLANSKICSGIMDGQFMGYKEEATYEHFAMYV